MKIAIIGAGNIGGAIACGLAKSKQYHTGDIICADPSQEALEKLSKTSPKLEVMTDNQEAVRRAKVVIFAVKPWLMEKVVGDVKPALNLRRHLIVSVAAGVTFEQLRQYLQASHRSVFPLFRAMPNTAIAIQESMTFIASNNATAKQTGRIADIFGEMGETMLLEERLMPAGTSLGSAGIAFAMRYIRAAIEGGVELGFYPADAQKIVLQTVKGATELLLAGNSHPEQEIDKVTTPGGVTIKGLNEMEASGFTTAVIRGLKAGR